MMKATMLVNLIAFFLLVGCQGKASLPIEGGYIGRYAGGVETLIIKNDKTYSQVFVRNGKKVFHNEGKWTKVNDTRLKFFGYYWMLPEGISPEEFYSGENIFGKKSYSVPASIAGDHTAIILNGEWNYYLTRKKASNE